MDVSDWLRVGNFGFFLQDLKISPSYQGYYGLSIGILYETLVWKLGTWFINYNNFEARFDKKKQKVYLSTKLTL